MSFEIEQATLLTMRQDIVRVLAAQAIRDIRESQSKAIRLAFWWMYIPEGCMFVDRDREVV